MFKDLSGAPLILIGAAAVQNCDLDLPIINSQPVDAAAEAVIMWGRVYTADGGTHTLDTSGSSSLGWRTGAVTFANAGTTVKVGLATMDAGNGPPARATNAAGVVTFSVSKSMTGGGGGVTANAWQEHVPDAGSLSVAHGDLIAFVVQMTARGGADAVNVQTVNASLDNRRPSVTSFASSSYGDLADLPNVVITFSDGTLGTFWGGFVASVSTTTQTWNSGSATKEYGNVIQLPFPTKVYGLAALATGSGDFDLVLYSDPLGTPAAEKTLSFDANIASSTSTTVATYELFASPYTLPANTPVAAIMKPGATNLNSKYLTLNAAAHQALHTGGANCYAVNRASGAFAPQNSSKDRFAIGLLVGAFHDAWGDARAGIHIGGL